MSLLELIQSSSEKRHTLFTWTTTSFETISNLPEYDHNEIPESVVNKLSNIISQLDTFIRYLSTTEDKDDLDSHYIFIRMSHVYSMALCRLQHTTPGKIFDSTELFIKVVGEEDVSLPDPTEQSSKKSKKKKSSSKRTHTHSAAKDLALVCLGQIFELFAQEVASLVPLIQSHIFKDLKKAMEKSKYRHATYMVSLLKLYNIILFHNDESDTAMTYINKFMKRSKHIFEGIYENDESFPVDLISLVIETWGKLLTQNHFLKENSNNLLDAVYAKFHDSELGIYGFVNDNTRIATAKILGDVLFDYIHTKQFITIPDAFNLYVKLFSSANIRDVRSGCFESMVHFITLNLSVDPQFLDGCSYLDILEMIMPIFDEKNINVLRVGTISRFMRYFAYTHDLLLPYVNEPSKIQILLKLLNLQSADNKVTSSKSVSLINPKVDNQWYTLVTLEFTNKILKDLGSSFTNETELTTTLKSTLLKLCISENFSIRVYAAKVTKTLLSSCKYMVLPIIESSLNLLSKGFSSQDKFEYSKLHGNAFLLANLIELADTDIVPYDLIMKITVFATSFIKNNTTSTSADLYFKGLICWILMSGLMNYRDESYLQMQTSQLFLFWKVLLTHSFTYHNEEELKRNLEIRTHALTCLLSYLNNTTIDKDTAKQISYLLTKCSNFNHSVELKSKDIDNILLANENRILQVYIKMKDFISADFNNSLLLLTMKNFSDPNLYIEPSKKLLPSLSKLGKSKRKEGHKKEPVISLTVDSILRHQGDFAYGLSSKIGNNSIRNMTKSNFTSQDRNKTQVNKLWIKDEFEWYRRYEEEVTKPISPVLSFDSLVLLYGRSEDINNGIYLPKVTSSLVDFSMELFSSVFPYLNSKIQYSVLETLNLSLFSKATTPLRSVAVSANICTMFYETLLHIQEKQLVLEEFVGKLIIDSLKKIEFHSDEFLTVLKSECLGLVYSAMTKQLPVSKRRECISDEVNTLIKNLVDIEEPYPRMFFVLSLSSIYKYNPNDTSFKSIYEIICTLSNDPHPVIHSWSIYAQYYLFEKHISLDLSVVAETLKSLENYLTNPTYGRYGDSSLRYNYCSDYNSYHVIGYLTRLLTEKIGPNFVELSKDSISVFKNITNSTLISTDTKHIFSGLKIYENIATFKLQDILNEKQFICTVKNILESSLLLGLGNNKYSILYTKQTRALPFPAGYNVVVKSFQLITQLLKLGKFNEVTIDFEHLAWRYLILYPDNEIIRSYFKEWLRCTTNKINWFEKLYTMMHISLKSIFDGMFESLQHVYSRYYTIHHRNNEGKTTEKDPHIVSRNVNGINWMSKDLIFELFVLLLRKSDNDPELMNMFIDKFERFCKIAFQGTSMHVESCNVKGLDLLEGAVRILESKRTAIKLDKETLREHEIQMTSALMPIFYEGASTLVTSKAISVNADILCLIGFTHDEPTRISEFMIKLLTVFNEKMEVTSIGACKFITKKSRREIEIAVLNSWAKITQEGITTENAMLITYAKPYWKILVPLWIISLREYLIIFYKGSDVVSSDNTPKLTDSSETKNTKLILYQSVWSNFTNVIGTLLFYDENIVLTCVNKDDLQSFMFLLVSRCLDKLFTSDDNDAVTIDLLNTIHNIIKTQSIQKLLLGDDIFPEFVGIFERTIKSSNAEGKFLIVELIDDFIKGYLQMNSEPNMFLADIDKLYELLRLLLTMIADLLPFIELDNYGMECNNSLTSEDINFVNLIFNALGNNIFHFPSLFKVDLYACLLFLLGRIFESKISNNLINSILPLLKSITIGLINEGSQVELISIFYRAVQNSIRQNLTEENFIAFHFVLLGNGYSGFSEEDIEYLASVQIKNMMNDGPHHFVVQGLIKLLEGNSKNNDSQQLFRNIFANILQNATTHQRKEIESYTTLIITLFNNQESGDKHGMASSLTMLLIYLTRLPTDILPIDVLKWIVDTAEDKPDLFKESLSNQLGPSQKNEIENILKGYINASEPSDKNENIVLKTFA